MLTVVERVTPTLSYTDNTSIQSGVFSPHRQATIAMAIAELSC